MILILIAIILAALIGMALIRFGNSGMAIYHVIMELLGMFMVLVCGVALLVYSVLCFSYISASYKANIINREYKTNYTQAEIFWAGDVIDTIKQIERQRIELNGDLLREKK